MKTNYFFILLLAIYLSCSSENDDSTLNTDNQEEMDMNDSNGGVTNNKLTGNFISGAHPTSGMAMVNEGRTELTLTNFKSDNGPLLELYLSTNTNASDYISLGKLKGLEGDFIYQLPKNINFENYKYIMVWCVDFSVNFGHAILE
ncbi:DM13 domain-containing protein [Abyssalbus ytuae]|uniref:DM13 domain-containing protein n=1 Tax=Abyssalbus ytuae TaxID=2926907 RepID=A0A9E7A035_9FLAO|nr:DM13 domain-containing protein [Abyssalbus ytuae]UOB17151.1 DM13 domain-containing protein [Abyssalbus ytuae]